MAKYLIGMEYANTTVYFKNIENNVAHLCREETTPFPNKKKAKRVLKRLNKYHDLGAFLIEVK